MEKEEQDAARYCFLTPRWRGDNGLCLENCLGYTKTEAIDAAIRMYDNDMEGVASVKDIGYRQEWTRNKKWRWLKSHGLGLIQCYVVVVEETTEEPIDSGET